MKTIVWFRGSDLRVSDHAPLSEAAGHGEVLPLFVLDPGTFSSRRAREAPHRTQFLCDSLASLDANLRRLGSRLVLVEGPAARVVPQMARLWNADRIWAYGSVTPEGRAKEDALERGNVAVRFFDGETLVHPSRVRTGSGRPYAVFTPFSRALRRMIGTVAVQPAPHRLPPVPARFEIEASRVPRIEDLELVRNPSVIRGGEDALQARLRAFFKDGSETYRDERDRMDRPGTSRLSADLGFGTLSIREAWNLAETRLGGESRTLFQRQLLWREFGYAVLWHRPGVVERPFRPLFERFAWTFRETEWKAWTRGQTGYPLVDAAARQLLAEGFVPNRARMVAASFLTKHLLIDYRLGEAHYLKFLVDGNRALNNLGWQWSAGCGCDAQPYFRVFNPVRQGQRFDPNGDYVRRWVPELSGLSAEFIHAPWEAPPLVLESAGVHLGETYPGPIVVHSEARTRFLELADRHVKSRSDRTSRRTREARASS